METVPKSFDVDEFLGGLTPRTVSVRVCSRRDLLEEHKRLEAELGEVSRTGGRGLEGNPEAERLALRLHDLEGEIEGAQREFVFRSIGARAWSDLLAKHPPSREHKKVAPGIDYDPDSFPAAAVAASAYEPELSLQQARQLEEVLTVSEWAALWGAALNANIGGDDNPKSLAAGSILRRKERSGTTAATGEFPDRSSLEG